MEKPKTSIVMPVHNEAKILVGNLKKLTEYLDSLDPAYEIVLVENGSNDNTLALGMKCSEKDPRIRILSIREKSLGAALKKGFKEAAGDILVWYPIDLSINLDYIEKSVAMMDDYDIVIGSKEHRDSVENRPLSRRIYSKFYNFLVNMLFNLHISDTQCVKTMRRDLIVPLADRSESGGIVFEVELLYRAKKQNLRITEIPVIVIDRRSDSKINLGVVKDAIFSIITLRFRI